MPRRKKRLLTAAPAVDSTELARRREEALRPWPTLGYDWDTLAMHLVSREAFGAAETMLRRATWLNPNEWRFKKHLAWCLVRAKRYAEAREWILKAMDGHADDAEAKDILRLIDGELRKSGGTDRTPGAEGQRCDGTG